MSGGRIPIVMLLLDEVDLMIAWNGAVEVVPGADYFQIVPMGQAA